MANATTAVPDEDNSIWQYPPSFALAVLALVLYSIICLWIFFTTVIKYRAWFFTTVVIGTATEVGGYVARVYSVKNQTNLPVFIVTLSLVVLAPIFISAGNYLLIGRLIRAVLPADRHRVLGIPARVLTIFFVTCDVISFLAQSSGSGIASSDDWSGPNEHTGRLILIGGLAFQAAAFSLYLCVVRRFHVLANRLEVETAPAGWRKVMTAVYISSSMILIRCIYRTSEFAEGLDGYAFRHEWLFWVFETLPMLIACGVFCWVHPSRYLGKDGGRSLFQGQDKADEEAAMPRKLKFRKG